MTPDIPVDRLGPFPLLQLAAGIAVLIGMVAAIYLGLKRFNRTEAEPRIVPEQRFFMDGPLANALSSLRELATAESRSAKAIEPLAEIGRLVVRSLDEIRDELRELRQTSSHRRR